MSGKSTRGFVVNPSFSQYTGTAAVPTDLTGWVVTSLANILVDTANYYRDFDGDTVPAALQFKTNNKIVQNFNVQNLKLEPYTPYYCQIAFNRQIGTCDGTLTLRLGNTSVNVVLAAQAGWNILRIPIGQYNWLFNFNKEDPTFEVELSGRTAGTLLIDDLIFGPYQFFDGCYYAPVGGATPWLLDDIFTFLDTETGAKIQECIRQLYGLFLPHSTGGGITWADPV
jgi:hypothetical protein